MQSNLKKDWNRLSQLIEISNKILLSTHFNADGDGLGSEIALYYHLKDLGKDCRIINNSPFPKQYKIIDPESIVEEYDSKEMDSWLKDIDLSIIVDIGELKRIAPLLSFVENKSHVIIDHHPSRDTKNLGYNIIDSSAPATGYMIWKYFNHISKQSSTYHETIINGLYVSLISDTGSFKYESTNADTHVMATFLHEHNLKHYELHKNIYEQKKKSQVKLLGSVINNLKTSSDGQISWFIIDQTMIKRNNATNDDVEGFTEFARGIENVEIAFMIMEVETDLYRINFRSSGKYSINDIASVFGGGGHKFAAGARVKKMDINDLENKIISLLENKIKDF